MEGEKVLVKDGARVLQSLSWDIGQSLIIEDRGLCGSKLALTGSGLCSPGESRSLLAVIRASVPGGSLLDLGARLLIGQSCLGTEVGSREMGGCGWRL